MLKPELLTLAALAACSMPAVEDTRDDVVNPDHGNGIYTYTNAQTVNEELHGLYRRFLDTCETQGEDASLSEITEERDEFLRDQGCPTAIRWVCNDLYSARSRVSQMGERIKIPTPFSCQASRRVQDRASR